MKRVFLGLALCGLFLTACNGNTEETSTEATDQKEQMNEGEAMDQAEEAAPMNLHEEEVSLLVKAVGETMTTMAYEPKQVSVPAGAMVHLTLENTATSEAMIHNLVVIQAGKQTQVTDAGLAAGKESGYLPDANMYIAATSLAQPGETVEVEFKAPMEKGTYQFICTYPGHTAMKGLFLVK